MKIGVINRVLKINLVQRHARNEANKTIVKPKLVYGWEAETIGGTDQKRLPANGMRFLRKIAGSIGMDKKRNAYIYLCSKNVGLSWKL